MKIHPTLFKSMLLIGIIAGNFWSSLICSKAGTATLTTNPVASNTRGNNHYELPIQNDSSVSFSISATALEGTVDPDGYNWDFDGGSVLIGDPTEAGPIIVTFTDDTIPPTPGQPFNCTVGLTHNGSDGETCTSNTKNIFFILVEVPKITVFLSSGPTNHVTGYTFTDSVFVSNVLNNNIVSIRQEIATTQAQQDFNGNNQSQSQIIANEGNSDIADTNGSYMVDTDWDWQIPDVGGNGDTQSLGPPVAVVSGQTIAYLTSTGRDFKVEIRRASDGETILEWDWGYSWTNTNCKWPANASPPAPDCASDNYGTPAFSGVYGITGL